MYGDNRNFFLAGGAGLLLVLLLTLTLTSLVRVSRLEKILAASKEHSLDSPGYDSPDQSSSPEEEISREQAFFEALDLWEKKQSDKALIQKETPRPNREEWSFLEALGLHMEPLSQAGLWSLFEIRSDTPISLMKVEFRMDEILLTSPGAERVSFSSLNGKAVSFIEQEVRRLRQEALFHEESARLFQTLSDDSSLQSLVKEKSCRMIPLEQEGVIRGINMVTLSEDRPILSLSFDTQHRYINDQIVDGSPGEFTRVLREQLQKADTRPGSAIAHEESLALIRSMYGDKGFAEYMKERGLYPQWTVREDEDFSYIDLVDGKGQFKAAFAVKKLSGRIYMVDEHEVPLVSLESIKAQRAPLPGAGILTETGAASLPGLTYAVQEPEKNSFTLLLVGYHNTGTDTMILAHINGDTQKISLISVPRDIWWQGKKINAYYFSTSRDNFLDLLTNITGIRIDYYLAMDMYAFIEVVNAMGGVDITLEKSVIDPSYRIIREDGTEGTLFYAPGTYHLDGVEALRLARSRHGSSDFDRSALQQQILSSMKERISGLSFHDTGLFQKFLSIALENGETNMSLPFMLKNLLVCRDYTLDGGHTLYDKSVLYNSYSNYYTLSSEEKEKARNNKDFQWGQWILLPVNNDWNLIRIKIREILGV